MRVSLGLKVVGAAVLLGLCVSAVRHEVERGALLSAARSEAKIAREALQDSLAVAARERERADKQAEAAAFERRTAEKLAVEANRLDAEVGRLEVAFKLASAQAPDTCTAIIGVAAKLLLAEKDVSARWRSAFEQSLQSYDSLAAAFTSAVRAHDAVAAPAEELARASQRLEKASRKSLFARLVPQLQFGAMAGADVLGRPNAVIGIGLGWSF